MVRRYPSGGPCCAEFEQEGRPLQLRDAAALLRKSDDPQGVLRGLRVIGPLIEAAPEELSNAAGRAVVCTGSCHLQVANKQHERFQSSLSACTGADPVRYLGSCTCLCCWQVRSHGHSCMRGRQSGLTKKPSALSRGLLRSDSAPWQLCAKQRPRRLVPQPWMYVLLGSRGFLHMHGQLDKHSCIGRALLTCHSMLGCMLKQQACWPALRVSIQLQPAKCLVPCEMYSRWAEYREC